MRHKPIRTYDNIRCRTYDNIRGQYYGKFDRFACIGGFATAAYTDSLKLDTVLFDINIIRFYSSGRMF
jgi:hypothetical protein